MDVETASSALQTCVLAGPVALCNHENPSPLRLFENGNNLSIDASSSALVACILSPADPSPRVLARLTPDAREMLLLLREHTADWKRFAAKLCWLINTEPHSFAHELRIDYTGNDTAAEPWTFGEPP